MESDREKLAGTLEQIFSEDNIAVLEVLFSDEYSTQYALIKYKPKGSLSHSEVYILLDLDRIIRGIYAVSDFHELIELVMQDIRKISEIDFEIINVF